MKFGYSLGWVLGSSYNGTFNRNRGTGYDIEIYPDGSTSRKKRSDALSPNFSRQPTFLSLKLKVYLSTSWKVSPIMYCSSTYSSSIYSWSHFGT